MYHLLRTVVLTSHKLTPFRGGLYVGVATHNRVSVLRGLGYHRLKLRETDRTLSPSLLGQGDSQAVEIHADFLLLGRDPAWQTA